MNRYNRHTILSEIGQTGQNRLLEAKVLVIGAGGLGCPILQYLAAAGIGTIGIVDFDTVEESNLQRQVLFGTSSLGINKALAAKRRLDDLNPTISIIAYPEKLIPENALSLLGAYDVIVDGTDDFDTRYLINDACVILDKPLVYGAIYKFEGQVAVFNYRGGPSYRCLFPYPPKEGSVASCSEVGVLGVLPGIIGTLQANEVLKIILELGDILTGKLLCYNTKTNEQMTLNIQRSDSEIQKIKSRASNFEAFYGETFCETPGLEISSEEALQIVNTQFIDVREPHEEPKLSLSSCSHIPLNELEDRLEEIDPTKNNIFVCQTGIRSKTAVTFLKERGIDNCFSLKEGITALLKQQKTEKS